MDTVIDAGIKGELVLLATAAGSWSGVASGDVSQVGVLVQGWKVALIVILNLFMVCLQPGPAHSSAVNNGV